MSQSEDRTRPRGQVLGRGEPSGCQWGKQEWGQGAYEELLLDAGETVKEGLEHWIRATTSASEGTRPHSGCNGLMGIRTSPEVLGEWSVWVALP